MCVGDAQPIQKSFEIALDCTVLEWHYILRVAALPQLDRGSDYESERHRFESCTPHQLIAKGHLRVPFFMARVLWAIRCTWIIGAPNSRQLLFTMYKPIESGIS